MVLSFGAMVLLMELPIVGQLTTKIQARYLIAFGYLALAGSMYLSTQRIDLSLSFVQATWLRILQYVPLGFIFIPASTAAYNGLPAEKNNAVAGLVNFVRNIGSSVGTSLVTTIIVRRAQFHQARLTDHTTLVDTDFAKAVAQLTQQLIRAGASAYDAERQAVARIYGSLKAQATTLGYIDTYFVLFVAAAAMFFLSFALAKNDTRSKRRVVMD
jgi:DHA2 family multidrug resistance protein